MTPPDSDTAGRGHTRVDLRAPRAPATPAQAARARLHTRAAGWISRLRDRTDPGAQLIVRLCRDLSSTLADLSIAERRADQAERARRFADARVAFMERGAIEQQEVIKELCAQLEGARESLRMLSAESFDVPTANEQQFDIPTTVRNG